MRMLLVGAGGVGESIVKILKERDLQSKWLEKVIVSDYNFERALEVTNNLKDRKRFIPEKIDARSKENIINIIDKHNCDFVMDAVDPYMTNNVFDAAYEAGVDYSNMGTWTVPLDEPKFGYGLENSFSEWMADYNFKQHEKWKKKNITACICLGIDPGVVDVFAKFAAEHLFDELHEVHVKDGGNLSIPSAKEDDIVFGFNVWTVMDEVLNPNVEWNKEKGFLVDKPFSGEEQFEMPAGVGTNKLVKIEHEETVLMPRYLDKYGLKKCSFKINLDENLVKALKVLDALNLRSLNEVEVGNASVRPRDLVAKVAPQPKDIGDEMIGKMVVGVHCIGIKDGKKREIFMYQPFDNEYSMKKWGMQAVVAQTGFGAAIGIELIGKGIWKDPGVYSPEYFDPIPYLEIMDESGFEYSLVEMESEYKRELDREKMKEIFENSKKGADKK